MPSNTSTIKLSLLAILSKLKSNSKLVTECACIVESRVTNSAKSLLNFPSVYYRQNRPLPCHQYCYFSMIQPSHLDQIPKHVYQLRHCLTNRLAGAAPLKILIHIHRLGVGRKGKKT